MAAAIASASSALSFVSVYGSAGVSSGAHDAPFSLWPAPLRSVRSGTCTRPGSPRRRTVAGSSRPAGTCSVIHHSRRPAIRFARSRIRAAGRHRHRTVRRTRLRRRGPNGPRVLSVTASCVGESLIGVYYRDPTRANFYSIFRVAWRRAVPPVDAPSATTPDSRVANNNH